MVFAFDFLIFAIGILRGGDAFSVGFSNVLQEESLGMGCRFS